LQVEGGAADHLQYVRARGLVFERFLQIAGAIAQFIEQAGILHRDDSLGCEILQQRDFFTGERLDFLAKDCDVAEQGSILAQRYVDLAACAGDLYPRTSQRIAGAVYIFVRYVDVDDDIFAGEHAPKPDLGMRNLRYARMLDELDRHAMQSRGVEALVLVGPQDAERGVAEPRRLFKHLLEHRCEIARRAVDNLQYLGGRGLLLQRLARLGQQPRILHRDNRLRREILQQRDLFLCERTDLLARGDDLTEQRTILAQRHMQRGSDAA